MAALTSIRHGDWLFIWRDRGGILTPLRAILVMRGDGEQGQGDLLVAFEQDGQRRAKSLNMLQRRRVAQPWH